MQVTLEPFNPHWTQLYQLESRQVAEALSPNVAAVHHIGSTAISTIYAKPIIDMLVEALDIQRVTQQAPKMEALGYEAMGELGIVGRRYFRKENKAGVRTHHVHVFEAGSAGARRHLAFRDYLLAHPDIAEQYSSLKRKLAAAHPDDIERYMEGKDPFIKDIERKALAWSGR